MICILAPGDDGGAFVMEEGSGIVCRIHDLLLNSAHHFIRRLIDSVMMDR